MLGLIFSLAIGALCGWIAGEIMNSKGTWLRNMILGICGSFVGNIVVGFLGISAKAGSIGGIAVSVLGSCLCIWLAKKLLK